MSSIQTLIGKRFEEILLRAYPELKYIGDEHNKVPDFEHPLFYAEAKVCYDHSDYASHLKQYQIEAFKEFEKEKPVFYLIGWHTFENSMERLGELSQKKRKEMLAKEMEITKLFIVDNQIISDIWKKRNYVSKKGHIQDCTLRERHLTQIINNNQIEINGETYDARGYYGIPPSQFSFSLPKNNFKRGLAIGHIIKSSLNKEIDYFYK